VSLLNTDLGPYFESGLLDGDVAKTLHRDLMPYGVKANRHVLETITRSVFEDGLVKRQVGLEELFAPNTLEL